MNKSFAGLVSVLLFAAACSGPAPVEFTTKDAGAIRQQNDTFVAAFNTKDVPKILELYAENSVFMPPNEPIIRGKGALKNFFTDLFKRRATNLRLDIAELAGHGPLAPHTGAHQLRTNPPPPPPHPHPH